MAKLRDWIRRHQVVVFFMIAYGITWGLSFAYDAVLNNEQVLLAPLAFLAFCGPALAGIIVTAICDAEPIRGRAGSAWGAFLLAWVISAAVYVGANRLLNRTPLSPAFVGFAAVAVIPVPIVISRAQSSRPAVRAYLSSLIRLRGVWRWALLALVLFPGLILLSIPVTGLLGSRSGGGRQFPATGLAFLGMVVAKFLYQCFFFNATGEEVGWRGFALPRLQSRTSPLIASLIVGLVWAVWHLFGYRAEGQPILTWQFWAVTLALHLPSSVIIGWLYNRSRGSILVAGIAHAAGNTTIDLLQPNLSWAFYTGTVAVGALVLVLVDRMWRKLPLSHPVGTVVHDRLALALPIGTPGEGVTQHATPAKGVF